MTAKEAIQTIEAAKAEVEWNYPLDYAAAFEVAIEVLEKQIPKRAISTYIGNYECPTCENYIDITDDDLYVYEIVPPEYCPNCGQALDWGETE